MLEALQFGAELLCIELLMPAVSMRGSQLGGGTAGASGELLDSFYVVPSQPGMLNPGRSAGGLGSVAAASESGGGGGLPRARARGRRGTRRCSAHAARGGAGGEEPAAHARERDAAPAGRRDARGARQGAPPYPRPRPCAWTPRRPALPLDPGVFCPPDLVAARRAAEQLRLSKKALAALQEVQAAPRPQLPAKAAEIDALRVARGPARAEARKT